MPCEFGQLDLVLIACCCYHIQLSANTPFQMGRPTKENGKKTHRMAGDFFDGQMDRYTRDSGPKDADMAILAL